MTETSPLPPEEFDRYLRLILQDETLEHLLAVPGVYPLLAAYYSKIVHALWASGGEDSPADETYGEHEEA